MGERKDSAKAKGTTYSERKKEKRKRQQFNKEKSDPVS